MIVLWVVVVLLIEAATRVMTISTVHHPQGLWLLDCASMRNIYKSGSWMSMIKYDRPNVGAYRHFEAMKELRAKVVVVRLNG